MASICGLHVGASGKWLGLGLDIPELKLLQDLSRYPPQFR